MRNTKNCHFFFLHKKFLKIFPKLMPLEYSLTFPFLKILVSKTFKDIYNPLTCFSRKSGLQKF